MSDNVHLRLRQEDDLDVMYAALCNNRQFLGVHLPWVRNYTPEAAYNDHVDSIEDIAQGKLALYCIFEDSEFIGCVSLHSFKERSAQLGYWLIQEAEGKGIMTAAAARVAAMGFGRLALDEVRVVTLPDNARSRAVAERLGGILDRTFEDSGGEVSYTITPDTLSRQLSNP